MGANLSCATLCDTNGEGPSSKPRLGDIPESCLALVLMHLDPPDICKLARLNRAFRGASSADFIWESKLPSNYKFICLIRFDGGAKEVWLDKNTGGLCFSISSKGLAITGIDDRRYWNQISTEESRFHTVAYLQQIWWFEIDGELEFEFPKGMYSLFFRLHLGRSSKRMGRRVCNSEHIHGWDIKPIDCTHTKGGLCVDAAFVYPSTIGTEICKLNKLAGQH
ncbi:hypothetical protein OIU76_005866 [Salix suchowensis]|nr:hypothetical protein OIU76_005866 [Salix suchowensis]